MEERKIQPPPIGIEPRYIHDARRAKEILDAIERYTNANMSIPKSWVEELRNMVATYVTL